jgi:hypothetical protein
MPGHLRLLAEGDMGAPIYWRTDPPCANSISAPKKKRLAGPQSKQSARLSLQLSELGPPNPLNRSYQGGDTLAYRRGVGWGPNTSGQTLWYSRFISCNKFHIAYWRTEKKYRSPRFGTIFEQ